MKEEVVSLDTWHKRHQERLRDQGVKPEKRDTLMSFVSDWHRLDKVKELVNEVGSYNMFDPEEVNQFLDECRAEFAAIGYDGSPVLYLMMPEAAPEGFVHREIADLLVGSDDASYEDVQEQGLKIIRAWWD